MEPSVASIAVVVNPSAGRNRRTAARVDRLADVLGGQGWVRETHSLEQLADVARECQVRQVELLGVCGGDGTLARTLTALVRAYGSDALPCILPLRAGTMNTQGEFVQYFNTDCTLLSSIIPSELHNS